MVEARKELKEQGQLIVDHPGEYVSFVAGRVAKLLVFLGVLLTVIMLILAYYNDKQITQKAQEERESMQAYQEHRKNASPAQLCQEYKQAWDPISVEPPCTPEELERWKENNR
jgi:hypothetical protein